MRFADRYFFTTHTGQVCIRSITLPELLHGVEKSAMVSYNLCNVEDFVSCLQVLPYDDVVVAHYGNVRGDLEKKSTPISVHDLDISGHARSESLVLATNTMPEFVGIEGLQLEKWLETKF